MKSISPHHPNLYQDMEMVASALSHDLQAPIRAVRNFTQHIAQKEREHLSQKGQLYCDFIVEANHQMHHFVQGIITYIRLEKQPLRPIPLALSELLHEICRELKANIDKSQAIINIPDNLPTLCCDLRLLRHAFKQLFINALLYVAPQTSPQLTITAQEQDTCLQLQFADNGIGISIEFFEYVFQPLKRLHNQEDYPGVGLGLTIANKAITMLGGQFCLDSTPGQGSTFSVTLPYKRNT